MPSEDSTRKRATKGEKSSNGAANGTEKKKESKPKDDSKKGGSSIGKKVFLGVFLLSVIAAGVYLYATTVKNSDPSIPSSKRKKSTGAKKQSEGKYSKGSMTSEEDMKIRLDLDLADSLVIKGDLESAIKKYDILLWKFPDSPRANFGKANALNSRAEKERSNELLEKCIRLYQKVVDMEKAPGPLVREAALLGADRMTFRGWQASALKLMKTAAARFPDDLELPNKLGVAYLITGNMQGAREQFKKVLEKDPKNGFAMVHMGFILKSNDQRFQKAIPLLQEGLKLKEPEKEDGKFYFHLGDALYRSERKDEAYEVYREGASKGYFGSVWQRSLYNVKGLSARPWWTPEQTRNKKNLQLLEDNWQGIRDEALTLMNNETHEFDAFERESEALTDKGDWRQFTLFARGRKVKKNCQRAPITCSLIEQIPDAAWCKRGQVKFSVMQPGVHVWPHCGPTNCRIRSHLGLVVPEGPEIRVAEEKRTWTEGKFLIFDDSFEHEVWHRGSSYRLVLIVDLWHPELSESERSKLSAI